MGQSTQRLQCFNACAQVDAGIKGVSPGVDTEDFLVSQQSLMRLWGGLAVAGLAVAAHLFDGACTQHLGFNLNSIMLVMITGYVTTALRQVCCRLIWCRWFCGPHTQTSYHGLRSASCSRAQAQSLMQLPRLARALARERAVLLHALPDGKEGSSAVSTSPLVGAA